MSTYTTGYALDEKIRNFMDRKMAKYPELRQSPEASSREADHARSSQGIAIWLTQ